jgi:hypothetical protein
VNTPIPKWVFGVSVLFALASFGVVKIAQSGPLLDWFVTLSATLISATLAIAGGIWLFHYQEDQRAEKWKSELAGALYAELYRMPRTVNPKPEDPLEITFPDGHEERVSMGNPQALIIEEAAKSSLFTPRFTEDLLSFAGNVGIYNTRVSQLNSFLSTLREDSLKDPMVRQLISQRVRDVKESQTSLKEQSERLLADLAEQEPRIRRLVQQEDGVRSP